MATKIAQWKTAYRVLEGMNQQLKIVELEYTVSKSGTVTTRTKDGTIAHRYAHRAHFEGSHGLTEDEAINKYIARLETVIKQARRTMEEAQGEIDRAQALRYGFTPLDCPACQPSRNAALQRCRDCGKTFETCPETLVPGDPSIPCVLARGHAGPHQDHILPKRRWT